MKRLIIILIAGLMLVGCGKHEAAVEEVATTSEPATEEVPITLEECREKIYTISGEEETLVEGLNLYFGDEKKLDEFAKIPAFDVSDYAGKYVRSECYTNGVEAYTQVDGVWKSVYTSSVNGSFVLPTAQGDYILIIYRENDDLVNEYVGTHIRIGTEEYVENPIDLDLLSQFEDYRIDEFIELASDNYTYEYYATGINEYLKGFALSEENNHQVYFNDFNYVVRKSEWVDDELIYTDLAMVEFRNGNEVTYNGKKAYVVAVPETFNGASQLTVATPLTIHDVVNNEEIIDVGILKGYESEEYLGCDFKEMALSDAQKEELRNALEELVIYDTEPVTIGVGGFAYYEIVVKTKEHTYTMENATLPLYVRDENENMHQYICNVSTDKLAAKFDK